jgi:hypothetical protein
MDWAIYIPTITTGVVGLAGIGGAILSSRMASKSTTSNLDMSITAEDRRAKVAEKRRIYARYLASIIEVVATTGNLEIYGGEADSDSKKALVVRVDESLISLVNALSELQLLASADVGRRAEDIGRAINEHANKLEHGEASVGGELYKMRLDLVQEMRADLGEATEIEPPVPLSA